MELFSCKKRMLLSENINGLLTALNDTRVMQQFRQVQSNGLADAESGKPIVKCLKIN